MKLKDPKLRLRWGGQGSLEEAIRLLEENGCVEIEMPAELHHAVFAHLRPDGWESQVEEIDQEGGVELLERLAEVSQLSRLHELVPLVRRLGAKVAVQSPAPHLVLTT